MPSTPALLLVLLATGCGPAVSEDAVWSDDGATTAELRVATAGGYFGASVAWTELAVGRRPFERSFLHHSGGDWFVDPSDSLFYMRSHGYLLVRWSSHPESVVAYDDETGLPRWSWGEYGTTIDWSAPSPDGEIVAAVTSDAYACWTEDGHEPDPECETRVGNDHVAYLDATTGDLILAASFPVIDWDYLSGDDRATWTPDGTLLVNTGGGTVVSVGADGTVADADPPGCWYPVTTSSPWDADGRPAGDSDGFTADRPAQAFGCQ